MANPVPNPQAVQATIQHAANTSMAEALQVHGAALSDTEKAVLGSMSPAEVKSLASAQSKLGAHGGGKLMNNNNNN